MFISLSLFFASATAMHSYFYNAGPLNWAAAKAACEANGQTLAVIQSAAEQAAARAVIPGNARSWIGFNDIASEMNFVWADGSPVCDTFWANGEPNNSGTENCVEINFSGTGQWNDIPCGASRPYVCSSGSLFPETCGQMAGGDVHYQTLSNHVYTFNGAGDYKYIDNDHVSIQTRSMAMENSPTTVFAAIALQDKASKRILEVWWSGESSEDVIFNTRDGNIEERKNEVLKHKLDSGVIVYDATPFVVSKFPSQHRFEIQHSKFDHFYLTGYYHGRSTFSVHVPKYWKNKGLAGNGCCGKNMHKVCHKVNEEMCADPKTTTNEQMHEIGLSWKVSDENTLFEKSMPVIAKELEYRSLTFSVEKLERARAICNEHQLCLYDYLATGSEQFANHTKIDFKGDFIYIGDKL